MATVMSTDSRSVILHQMYGEQNAQFDRFVLGATLAACAYLAQTNPFGHIDFNIESMYLYSLIQLAVAALIGFKRVEATVFCIQLNSRSLAHLERGDAEGARVVSLASAAWAMRAFRRYRYRNLFLMTSFLCYIATKVFETYVR